MPPQICCSRTMRPALERTAVDPVAFARVEVERSAALRRLQAAGPYGAVMARAERAACARHVALVHAARAIGWVLDGFMGPSTRA